MKVLATVDIMVEGAARRSLLRLSVELLLLFGLAFGMLLAALEVPLKPSWTELALSVSLIVVPLPVHELVHAAAFKLVNPRAHVRFGMQNGLLYTTCEPEVFTRAQMLVVMLCPFVLLTPAIFALGWTLQAPFAAALAATIHASECAGDLLFAKLVLTNKQVTHVRDTSYGIDLLSSYEA